MRADDLNLIVERLDAHTRALSAGRGETRMVECASGETIEAAMGQAYPGDTIMISGTCEELVVVNKDGGGSAVIDGGGASATVILIRGHRNLIINSFHLLSFLNDRTHTTTHAQQWQQWESTV